MKNEVSRADVVDRNNKVNLIACDVSKLGPSTKNDADNRRQFSPFNKE